MYSNFFGFLEKPFELTPDPKFLYQTEGLRETLATLIYGIQQRRGFILLIGEPGTGKTTLLNAVMDQVDENTKVAFLFNIGLTFGDMLHVALDDLDLVDIDERFTKRKAIQLLKDVALKQYENGRNLALIIDEAQNLDPHALENLRLLSNLETRAHKLIQIVLAGQPELDITLRKPQLRQLVQRVGLRRETTPLNEKDTYEYIEHRLKVVDYQGPPIFSIKAKKLIWSCSQGIPRNINTLCDNSLLAGYALDRKRIDSAIVEETVQDLSWKSAADSYENPADSTPEEQIPQQGGDDENSDDSNVSHLDQLKVRHRESSNNYGTGAKLRKPFFAQDKHLKDVKNENVAQERVEQDADQSDIKTKKRFRKRAVVFFAFTGILLILIGYRFLKFDTNKLFSASPQNGSVIKSVIKSDIEKPPPVLSLNEHAVIYFNPNSFEIPNPALEKLNRLADFMMNNPEAEIRVKGYTDSTGSYDYNVKISKIRANAVKMFLLGKGVDPTRIEVLGLGPKNPIASNATSEGRKLNRRVEIDLNVSKSNGE